MSSVKTLTEVSCQDRFPSTSSDGTHVVVVTDSLVPLTLTSQEKIRTDLRLSRPLPPLTLDSLSSFQGFSVAR